MKKLKKFAEWHPRIVSNFPMHLEKNFRPDVEGLRAIAVLSVVIFHLGIGALPGGFVGVDVFFVISGYLITGILLGELQASGSIDFLRFYGRRARRLLPASLLVMAVTMGVGLLILSPTEQVFAAKGAFTSSLYASNFWFMTLLADYFAPESAVNPFLHTWSLAVEEQFYLVWPTLLLVLWQKRPSVRKIALAMLVISAASFLLCIWLTFRKHSWAFYASPARAWEFGIGALAVLQPVTNWSRRSVAAAPLGWLGMGVLGVSLLTFAEPLAFPGWAALLPVAATAAVLVSGASGQRGSPASLLKLPLMQWFGKHSYSIYLWHWPILVYARVLNLTDPTSVVVCGALILICAAASFRLLESPVRASAWLTATPARSLRFGVALTLAGGLIAVTAGLAAQSFLAQGSQATLARWIKEQPTASGSERNCLIGFTESQPTKCVFGSSKAFTRVVLFGDSHADQWSTPLANLAAEKNWQLVTLLKSSCAVSDIPVYNMRLRRHSPECTEWRAKSMEEIRQLHPNLVIVAEYSKGYIQGPWTTLGNHAVSLETWGEGLGRTLQQLREMKVPVLVLNDSPTPDKNVGHCIARSLWRGTPETACDVKRSAALAPEISALESQVAASTGARFGDLSAEFCDQNICPAMKSGMLVYRDANHVTAGFASQQAMALQTLIGNLRATNLEP